MIFNSISLENFGIIKQFSKQFEKNILVLAGENGAGKSTVLKAILLAVFDDYEGVLADYVNWESDYFQVAVNFTHRGIDYESFVRFDGATDRALRFGGKVLKGDEAKRKIKEVIDVDLLKAGMLSAEQEIALVETKPAERREYLKRIYNIEFSRQLSDLENDIKASEIELAKKTSRQSEIENRKYTIPEKLTLPFTKEDYDLKKANLEIDRKKIIDIENKNQAYLQMHSELNILDDQRSTLRFDFSLLEAKIEKNQAELQKLPELKEKWLEIEKDSIMAAECSMEMACEMYDTAHGNLTKELKAVKLERLPVFNIEDFTAVSQELFSRKAKLSELESAKDVCPTCGQSISSPEHIAKRREEISEITKQIGELSMKFEAISVQKAKREQAENGNFVKANKITEFHHKIALMDKQFENEKIQNRAKLEQAKRNIENLNEKYKAEEEKYRLVIKADADNYNNIKRQLDENKTASSRLKDKLQGMKIILMDGAKANILKMESDIHRYDDIISRNFEIARMELQIAVQKENDLKQLEEVRSEIQVLNELIGNWKLGIKILKTEFPVYVISRVIKDIEKSMNEFLKRTYPKYVVEIQDKKNALYIVYGPKKKEVSSASGFERQIFSLSFMYAVSRAIGSRCLLLDECDSAATERNSGVFYRVIGDSIGQGIDQIILISHKPTTRNILEYDFKADVMTFVNGVAV